MFGWVFDSAVAWMSAALIAAVHLLWDTMSAFAFTSPDVTALPQVEHVSSRSLMVVNTVYVLAVMTAGVLVMVRDTVQLRYGIGELAPRLVLGLVGANAATPLCRGMIQASDALTSALAGDPISSDGLMAQLSRAVVVELPTQDPVGEVRGQMDKVLVSILAALLLMISFSLLFGWISRLGVLVLLTAIAPLALACHAVPYTDPVAKLWWRSMLATLLIVTVQAFALHTALVVFLDPNTDLHALGLPDKIDQSVHLATVVCLLWGAARIPSLARRHVLRGSGRGGSAVISGLVVHRLARTALKRVASAHPATRVVAAGAAVRQRR